MTSGGVLLGHLNMRPLKLSKPPGEGHALPAPYGTAASAPETPSPSGVQGELCCLLQEDQMHLS